MQKHYYALRYQVDRDEWRARAKRTLIFQLWKKFHPQAGKKGRLLDFGCGSGLFINEFEKGIRQLTVMGSTSPKRPSAPAKKGA